MTCKHLKTIFIAAISFLFLTMQSFAGSGDLFRVSSSSSGDERVNIDLCLNIDTNGQPPFSCQQYDTQTGTLTINTTTDDTYYAAGIRVNTPGYVYTPFVFYGNPSQAYGYMLLGGAVSRNQAASGILSPTALRSIAVTPAYAAIAASTTQQFTATGTYANGATQDITAITTWVSSDPTVATIAAGQGRSKTEACSPR